MLEEKVILALRLGLVLFQWMKELGKPGKERPN
jgi:hypothetical protein